MMVFLKVPSPLIKGKDGQEVKYPVSYAYNGGIRVNGKWYQGFKVGKPIVPDGFELVNIGVGLQLNCHPPLATSRLQKKK